MAKIWTTPWAATGDKNVIPDPTQPDGSVSISTGWGFDYQRPYVDPLAKDIARADMNGVLNEITNGLGEVQKQGAASWSATAGPYGINAQVYHSGAMWTSAIANNSATPGAGPEWINFSSQDPTLTVRGIPLLSSVAEAQSWVNDTKMITPAKLAAAFGGANSSLGTVSGFQKYPSGMIFQWGGLSIAANTSSLITLPSIYLSQNKIAMTCENSSTTTTISGSISASIVSLSQIRVTNRFNVATSAFWYSVGN